MRREKFSAETVRAFGPSVRTPRAWIDPDASALELPGRDGMRALEGARDVEQILVTHWPESFGQLEETLAKIAAASPTRLALSFQNRFAPSLLREQLCRDRAAHASAPLLGDREISFEIGRVVRALGNAGFAVCDVQQVLDPLSRRTDFVSRNALQVAGREVSEDFDRRCERFLVRAERLAKCPGSALVAMSGSTSEADVARTRSALQSVLPASWELIFGAAESCEAASWNDAVARSHGDRVWLLRAGDEPSAAQFAQLDASSKSCVLASEDSRLGLGAAMLDRAMLLDVGPLVSELSSQIVAGEEWRMRAEHRGYAIDECTLVEPWTGSHAPRGGFDEVAVQALLDRWKLDGAVAGADTPASGSTIAPWKREGREASISLCMIVRDEERFLGACLERVASVVDEIVIVDTGSTDRSVEIADAHGARVLHFEWCDDFSAARNHGLAAATGDWILVLDADELIAEDSLPRLRQLAQSERSAGYYLSFVNDHEVLESQGICMPRMFRRFESLRFVGVIHEQVIESLQAEAEANGLAVYPSDVCVLHFGCSDEVVASREKNARNDALFQKQLALTPEHPYFLYKYADFLRSIDPSDERIRTLLERAHAALLAMSPEGMMSAPFAGEVVALLALELAASRRQDEAWRLLRDGLRSFPPTPNLLYVAGGVAQGLELHREAIDCFDRLLELGARRSVVPVQGGITSYVARGLRAVSLAALGHEDAAAEILEVVLREHGHQWDAVWLHAASLAVRRGRPQEARQLLEGAARRHDASPALRQHAQNMLARIAQLPLPATAATETARTETGTSETAIELPRRSHPQANSALTTNPLLRGSRSATGALLP